MQENNTAFIDGQNLHSGISAQRWKLDHKKFREYLRDDLGVQKAYIFIGFMEEHQDLYNTLQEAGFILFFKPLVRHDDGTIKGNVDADMVLKCMIDIEEYAKAVIVSGDGDFAGLIRHLATRQKLKRVIIPNRATYSSLFKRMDQFDSDMFEYIHDLRGRVEYHPSGLQPKAASQSAVKSAKSSEEAAPLEKVPVKRTRVIRNRLKPKVTQQQPATAARQRHRAPKKPEDRLLQAIDESST